MRELHSLGGELRHVGRADFGGAVGLGVQLTVVIGNEDDHVGLRGAEGRLATQNAEDRKEQGGWFHYFESLTALDLGPEHMFGHGGGESAIGGGEIVVVILVEERENPVPDRCHNSALR